MKSLLRGRKRRSYLQCLRQIYLSWLPNCLKVQCRKCRKIKLIQREKPQEAGLQHLEVIKRFQIDFLVTKIILQLWLSDLKDHNPLCLFHLSIINLPLTITVQGIKKGPHQNRKGEAQLLWEVVAPVLITGHQQYSRFLQGHRPGKPRIILSTYNRCLLLWGAFYRLINKSLSLGVSDRKLPLRGKSSR
jgi:hypothetical protein